MTGALAQWSEFHVAMTGACTALAGLVIVAASVNIRAIVRAGSLTARLAAAIAALVLAMAVSAAALVPVIDAFALGLVTLIAAVGAAVFQAHATRVMLRDPDQSTRRLIPKSALGVLPIIAYLAAGALLVAGQSNGLLLAAAGSVLAIVAALLVSWVVLVEVLR